MKVLTVVNWWSTLCNVSKWCAIRDLKLCCVQPSFFQFCTWRACPPLQIDHELEISDSRNREQDKTNWVTTSQLVAIFSLYWHKSLNFRNFLIFRVSSWFLQSIFVVLNNRHNSFLFRLIMSNPFIYLTGIHVQSNMKAHQELYILLVKQFTFTVLWSDLVQIARFASPLETKQACVCCFMFKLCLKAVVITVVD